MIDGWEKGYSEVHSATFTKDQLLCYHRVASDLDGDVILNKAYSVIAISFATRSSESHTLEWKYVAILHNPATNTHRYAIGVCQSWKKNEKKNQVLFQKELFFVWGCQI
jgi:hypothetical protein